VAVRAGTVGGLSQSTASELSVAVWHWPLRGAVIFLRPNSCSMRATSRSAGDDETHDGIAHLCNDSMMIRSHSRGMCTNWTRRLTRWHRCRWDRVTPLVRLSSCGKSDSGSLQRLPRIRFSTVSDILTALTDQPTSPTESAPCRSGRRARLEENATGAAAMHYSFLLGARLKHQLASILNARQQALIVKSSTDQRDDSSAKPTDKRLLIQKSRVAWLCSLPSLSIGQM
jgi:hypothetical protein